MTIEPGAFRQELRELAKVMRVLPEVDHRPYTTHKIWNRAFGDISPKQLYQRIAAATPNPSDTKLWIELGNNNHCTLNVQYKRDIMERVHGLLFSIDYPGDHQRNASIHHAELDPLHQAKGVTRRYLRECVALLKDIGVNKLTVAAGDSVGGYAWAKYGFCPQASEQSYLATEIRTKIQKKHSRFELSQEVPAIEAVLSAAPEEWPTRFSTLTDLNRVLDDSKEPPLTVGKYLLLHSGWKGESPLQDGHPGYERFKTYTDPQRMREVMP